MTTLIRKRCVAGSNAKQMISDTFAHSRRLACDRHGRELQSRRLSSLKNSNHGPEASYEPTVSLNAARQQPARSQGEMILDSACEDLKQFCTTLPQGDQVTARNAALEPRPKHLKLQVITFIRLGAAAIQTRLRTPLFCRHPMTWRFCPTLTSSRLLCITASTCIAHFEFKILI